MHKDRGSISAGILALIAVAALIVGIGVAGWHFSWWLKEKNTDKQVQIDNRNLGTQTAWRDQIRTNIADFYTLPADNLAARNALRNQICGLANGLTKNYRTDDIETFTAKECR